MPQLARPLTASGAHRFLASRPDSQGQAQAHVTKESLKAQANAGGAHDAVVFGFAAAQAKCAWVADQVFVMWEPSITHPPDVDLRMRRQPTQSVSLYKSMASHF